MRSYSTGIGSADISASMRGKTHIVATLLHMLRMAGYKYTLVPRCSTQRRTQLISRGCDDNGDHVLLDVPDMAKLNALLAPTEGKKAMEEDGPKPQTIRMLAEGGRAVHPAVC